MTNREWLESLTEEEYEYFSDLIICRCQLCAYWDNTLCFLDDVKRCVEGHNKWLDEEHKEGE